MTKWLAIALADASPAICAKSAISAKTHSSHLSLVHAPDDIGSFDTFGTNPCTEDFEERAAILEFDGGLSRSTAEKMSGYNV